MKNPKTEIEFLREVTALLNIRVADVQKGPDYEEEPEIVECEITEQKNGTLGYDRADGITQCSLGSALSYPDFIGFKFEGGQVELTPIVFKDGISTKAICQFRNLAEHEVLHATHVLFRGSK